MSTNFKEALNKESAEWRARLAYKCGVCGKEYDFIKDRAECEIKCSKKKEEEKKLAAEKKKKEEQATRKKEVEDAIAHATKLRDKYIEDYGGYVQFHDTDLDDILDLFGLSSFFVRLP